MLLIVTAKSGTMHAVMEGVREKKDIACIVRKQEEKPVLAINTRLTILLQLRYVGRKPEAVCESGLIFLSGFVVFIL